jgi:4-alpha-glucanotransferase
VKTAAQWAPIGLKPHHGIALPLSALHSKKSCGIGEFHDLIPLIDWCHSIGFDTIQLLPLNDTGADPSPYNPISSCALDPIYLSLADLPGGDSLAPFQPFLQEQRLNFQAIKAQKITWLTRYFNAHFLTLVSTDDYQNFLRSHPWLSTYALFKAYKDRYDGKPWKDWPLRLPDPDQDLRPATDFHTFLQYLCFTQMARVRAHATKQGVFLMGDVPILPSPDSADVWGYKELFDLSLQAGAPPDYYNPLGQKWGFPLYDWETMRHTHFAWWKQRLHTLEELYHIYRLDHVVGYFRIWAIPDDQKASEGHFVPQDPSIWPDHGREILSTFIDASSLLPIAEDLGTIPKEVPPILKELGICSTKVLRWERNWKGDKSFIPYDQYEPLSITTVSTLDSDTLTLWWKKYPEEAAAFARFKHWAYQPELTHDQRLAILYDSHHTPSLFHINLLQETLALFPELIWPNPEDERINIPGSILPKNWTYRFRPSLEEILNHREMARTCENWH